MRKLVVLVFLLTGLLASFDMAVAAPVTLEIFPSKNFNIKWSKCGHPSARQFIRVDTKKDRINWMWKRKKNIWCGWSTENLPRDVSKYSKGHLIIELMGRVVGNLPEIKLIDFENGSTSLVRLSPNNQQDIISTGIVTHIPMADLLGEDIDFSPVQIKNIKGLQIDADFESIEGEIRIRRIAIESAEPN